MNEENLNLMAQVPTSDLIPCHLKFHDLSAMVYVGRKQIFKLQPESFLGVCLGVDLEVQRKFQCSPFLAFQMRVTSDFQVEQMGDGFPCGDEAKANEVLEIIKAKNNPVPRVVLAGWSGHFGFVTVTSFNLSYDEMAFFIFDEPQKIGEGLSGFSIRHINRSLGERSEHKIELHKPTIAREMP
jgi:hypothetical protein